MERIFCGQILVVLHRGHRPPLDIFSTWGVLQLDSIYTIPSQDGCNYSDSDNSCSHQPFAEFLVDPKLPRNYPRFQDFLKIWTERLPFLLDVRNGRREAKCDWQRPNLRGFQGHENFRWRDDFKMFGRKNTHARWFIPWPFWGWLSDLFGMVKWPPIRG